MQVTSSSFSGVFAGSVKNQDAVSAIVLKKAMNAQAQTATQLINAIPKPPSNSNLGQNVNLFA